MKPSEMNEEEWKEFLSIRMHENPLLRELEKHSALPKDSHEEFIERLLKKQIDEEGKSNA